MKRHKQPMVQNSLIVIEKNSNQIIGNLMPSNIQDKEDNTVHIDERYCQGQEERSGKTLFKWYSFSWG